MVVIPAPFRGGPSAAEIAEELAEGARNEGGRVSVETLVSSDGGDGALEAIASWGRGTTVARRVTGPTGAPVEASFWLTDDGTAMVAVAEASGLGRVPPGSRNPMRATTRGTGEMVAAALDAGARRVLLAAGGSPTTDMGAGALAALGVAFHDDRGKSLPAIPAHFDRVAAASLEEVDPRLRKVPITVLSDVRTPLAENLATFGAQKGFTTRDGERVARGLRRLARAFGFTPAELLDRPWLGAGGGITAGFRAAFGAEVRSGSSWFLRRGNAIRQISDSALVLTAEGRFDRSSLQGKLPGAVAGTAARLGVPTTIVAGSVAPDVAAPPLTRLVDLKLPPRQPGRQMEETLRTALRDAAADAVNRCGPPHRSPARARAGSALSPNGRSSSPDQTRSGRSPSHS